MNQAGKKQMQGNQLSGAGGASAPVVPQIAEIFFDMTASYVVRTDDGHIICMEPGNKLLNICTVRLNSQRALVQFTRKLVQ